MKRTGLCALIVFSLCAGAAAQFDQFDWTLENHGGLDVGLQPDSMWFNGLHSDAPGTVAVFKTSSPVAGRVSVATNFWIEELVCGSSNALYVLGNQVVTFSNCFSFVPVSFDVDELQTFGFGMKVNNPSWSASLNLTAFTFTPCWTVLEGALPGTAGTPSLEGHGLLKADGPFSMKLSGAMPSASVALVVGFGQVNLPFKGGVLVPSVDALITGLVSDVNGQFDLASIWPAGVPAGSQFFVQSWIADPAGPSGFAASNAVQGIAL